MPAFQEILAHGTNASFVEFNLSFCKRTSMGRGFYFTSDFSMAQFYSGGMDPIVARITLDNPFEIDGHELAASEAWERSKVLRHPDARENLIDMGYDGVIYREGDWVEVSVFHPEQIESFGRHTSFEAAGALEMTP